MNKRIVDYQSPSMGMTRIYIPPELDLNMLDVITESEGAVLVHGPTGSGKDVLADYIASLCACGSEPTKIMSINCAAISSTLFNSELFGHLKGSYSDAKYDRPGILKSMSGGVLILEELGEVPTESQAAFLRYMQTGEIRAVGSDRPQRIKKPIRIIATTNVDVYDKAVFRKDLRERFTWPLKLVSVAEDRRKIPLSLRVALADHPYALSADLLAAIFAYDWPGNTREIFKCCERALLFASSSVDGVLHRRNELLELPFDVSVRLKKYAHYLLHLHEKHYGLEVFQMAKSDESLRLGLMLLRDTVGSLAYQVCAIPVSLLESDTVRCSLALRSHVSEFTNSSVAEFLTALTMVAYNPYCAFVDDDGHDQEVLQEGNPSFEVPEIFLCEERAEISDEFLDGLAALRLPLFNYHPPKASDNVAGKRGRPRRGVIPDDELVVRLGNLAKQDIQWSSAKKNLVDDKGDLVYQNEAAITKRVSRIKDPASRAQARDHLALLLKA